MYIYIQISECVFHLFINFPVSIYMHIIFHLKNEAFILKDEIKFYIWKQKELVAAFHFAVLYSIATVCCIFHMWASTEWRESLAQRTKVTM